MGPEMKAFFIPNTLFKFEPIYAIPLFKRKRIKSLTEYFGFSEAPTNMEV
jgi:hypothetical protein